ncbi:MAG: hypothetical protein EBS42_14490 [Caulobacteraceae bacterium]|nr:hypothetical protein [Caulobacteraceae bacterium]
MTFDRRTLLGSMAGLAALAPFLAVEQAMAAKAPPNLRDIDAQAAEAHVQLMQVPGLHMHGDEDVVMLLYPGFTALDLVGPHYFFASMMGATVHLATNQSDLSPVSSDLGLAIAPTITLAQAPRAPTVVFVPGGTTGTLEAAADPATLAYVKTASAKARFTTSVEPAAMVSVVYCERAFELESTSVPEARFVAPRNPFEPNSVRLPVPPLVNPPDPMMLP